MDIIKPPKKSASPVQFKYAASDLPTEKKFNPKKNVSFQEAKSDRQIIKFILRFLGIIFLISLFYLAFLIFKVNKLGEKINPSSKSTISLTETIKNFAVDDFPILSGTNQGQINILLLGIAGEKKPGQNLTDTIMIVSINTKTNRVGLLSLPRDLFVEIPKLKIQSKINSVYQIGLKSNNRDPQKAAELIENTVEEITSLDINYYVILDFEGFEKIIDSIGGINIMNERDIYDASYPGPNYSYETFELEKGFHELDGKMALKYARERHSDPAGDFGRAKRQQQVLQAVKNKVFSAKTFLNIFTLNDLLNALGKNIKTNITIDEIGSFMNLIQKLDTQNINNVVVDAWNKESFLKVAHIAMGNVQAFALIPRVGNWSEIQEVAQNIFSLNEIQRRKEMIQKENAQLLLVNTSGENTLTEKVRQTLMEHLNYKNISLARNLEKEPREKTYVYDLGEKNQPFTLDEIIKTLPAELSPNNSPLYVYINKLKVKPNIVVILGKDLIDIYNIEEGTLEDLEKQQEAKELELLNANK